MKAVQVLDVLVLRVVVVFALVVCPYPILGKAKLEARGAGGTNASSASSR
jgi:hypothetical protein